MEPELESKIFDLDETLFRSKLKEIKNMVVLKQCVDKRYQNPNYKYGIRITSMNDVYHQFLDLIDASTPCAFHCTFGFSIREIQGIILFSTLNHQEMDRQIPSYPEMDRQIPSYPGVDR